MPNMPPRDRLSKKQLRGNVHDTSCFILSLFILQAEKFLKFDWPVVFQPYGEILVNVKIAGYIVEETRTRWFFWAVDVIHKWLPIH